MNIYVELNNIIEYIEKNLEEEINYKEIAKIIGVNEYTFQKIFSVICNISLKEYIRNRRLSNAGEELYLTNEKIIDIALKYQYNNATAFSRAFEKFHGIKPSEVKKNPEKLRIYTKIHFDEINNINANIEYKIIEKEEMILYGKCKNTNNLKISKDAPNFYKEMSKKYGEPLYGIVEYKDKDRLFIKAYWILYNEKYEGFQSYTVPSNKYILIKIKSQNADEIQKASKIFYYEFLPSCKYNLKDTIELEYYHDDITEFLIPIED